MGDAEQPWWKKAAQGVMDTVKDKIEKKEPAVQPNMGMSHPDVLAGISDRFRGDVLHTWELGKFKSEKDEVSCYGVVFKQEFEFDGISCFRSIFVAYSGGKAQFAKVDEPALVRSDMTPNFIAKELGWFSMVYTLYKEFASTKPWVKFKPEAFEEFAMMKAKTAKK